MRHDYIGLDARRILEFLGIPASINRISVVVEYLGKWPMGSNGKKHYNIYIGADISGTKPIYRKNEIQVASSMTHIKFIKQYVLTKKYITKIKMLVIVIELGR